MPFSLPEGQYVRSSIKTVGQLRFAGGILYGNTDSDTATSEFQILLTRMTSMAATDFIL